MNPKKRHEIFSRLRRANPNPTTELEYGTPFELLVAVVLSAQATDKSVNLATRKLFPVMPQKIVDLGIANLEKQIQSIGLYRTKARNLVALSKILLQEHGGEVPAEREALERLPGVGRKTANVVLGNAYDTPGLVVDTHVSRVAQRLELTRNTDPVKIEADLMELVARKDWTMFSHAMIFHGRRICVARKPKCDVCPLLPDCPYPKRAKRLSTRGAPRPRR